MFWLALIIRGLSRDRASANAGCGALALAVAIVFTLGFALAALLGANPQ